MKPGNISYSLKYELWLEIYVWRCLFSNGIALLKMIGGSVNKKKFIFQPDIAASHKHLSTSEFLQKKKINMLEWSGYSPDIKEMRNI